VTCCAPKGYRELFGERAARRDARRYRRKGLDETAERMVDFLRGRGLDDATVLEIGGGVGAIGLELLKAGAGRAVEIELSPNYERTAAELAHELGFEGRVERRLGDVVAEGETVPEADAVVLHRVVCCYPDVDALVGAAGERARSHLVLSFPRDRGLVRAGRTVINLWFRLRRWDFRFHLHPRAAILAAAERRGLRPVLEHQGAIWQVAALERTSS
jgi:magnesium-protoporphyrin O-methyltransferase